MQRTVFSVCVVLLAASAVVSAVNNAPIIGIITLPCDGDSLCGNSTSYFPASYVKYLEGGGAQVVPVFNELSTADMLDLFDQLNGVFFTGGTENFNGTYWNAITTAVDYALKVNAQGDYFPVWGTCLGFQALVTAVSQNLTILTEGYNSENYTIPLNFTSNVQNSRILSLNNPLASFALSIFATQNVTMNNHNEGVTPADFAANSYLSSTFNVLATNMDRNGTEFVSLIEGKTLPLYGAQFHPEKNMYEWATNEAQQHTASAVLAAEYLSLFFVDETRKSNHAFSTPQALADALIYNYNPVFMNGEFTQAYFWTYSA